MHRLISLVALVGCASPSLTHPTLDGPDARIAAYSAAEEAAILHVANTATFDELDLDVGLDVRAAENIVEHRDGADALPGTADDDLFSTLDELDAISWVGPAAIEALRTYAADLGLIESDGEMGYTAEEVEAALDLANTASLDVLDIDVGLDVRAAEGIVETRAGSDGIEGTADDQPFTRLATLDAVPYVGPAAIDDLVTFAMASAPAPEGCLILSEYIEGSGTYNKAIEVYNCGDSALELADYGVCIVRNDDVECTTADTFVGGTLAAGEVYTACRSTRNHTIDPYPQLAEKCDQEMSLLSFSGNDRIVVFQDLDGDGDYGAADRLTDMLGRFDWVPSWEIWSNVGLRRCDLSPWLDTGWYDHTDWFTEHNDFDVSAFGLPPVEGCY